MKQLILLQVVTVAFALSVACGTADQHVARLAVDGASLNPELPLVLDGTVSRAVTWENRKGEPGAGGGVRDGLHDDDAGAGIQLLLCDALRLARPDHHGKRHARRQEDGSAVLPEIDYELRDALPANAGRFHAQLRRQNPTVQLRDYMILDGAEGPGHFLGCVIGVRPLGPSWPRG